MEPTEEPVTGGVGSGDTPEQSTNRAGAVAAEEAAKKKAEEAQKEAERLAASDIEKQEIAQWWVDIGSKTSLSPAFEVALASMNPPAPGAGQESVASVHIATRPKLGGSPLPAKLLHGVAVQPITITRTGDFTFGLELPLDQLSKPVGHFGDVLLDNIDGSHHIAIKLAIWKAMQEVVEDVLDKAAKTKFRWGVDDRWEDLAKKFGKGLILNKRTAPFKSLEGMNLDTTEGKMSSILTRGKASTSRREEPRATFAGAEAKIRAFVLSISPEKFKMDRSTYVPRMIYTRTLDNLAKDPGGQEFIDNVEKLYPDGSGTDFDIYDIKFTAKKAFIENRQLTAKETVKDLGALKDKLGGNFMRWNDFVSLLTGKAGVTPNAAVKWLSKLVDNAGESFADSSRAFRQTFDIDQKLSPEEEARLGRRKLKEGVDKLEEAIGRGKPGPTDAEGKATYVAKDGSPLKPLTLLDKYRYELEKIQKTKHSPTQKDFRERELFRKYRTLLSKKSFLVTAYPSVSWAGPALDQVGNLVGGDMAQWASELAGQLAAKFDYISYPSLVGGPADLKKEAYDYSKKVGVEQLALSPEEAKILEKFLPLAKKIAANTLKNLYERSSVAGEKEGLIYLTPDEIYEAAQDVLLEIVSSPDAFVSNDKMKLLLQEKMNALAASIQEEGRTALPSNKTGKEDLSKTVPMSLDEATSEENPTPLVEVLEPALSSECAADADQLFEIGDKVKVSEDVAEHGEGKIIERLESAHYCDRHHKSELIYVYHVEFPQGKTTWVTGEDLEKI